MQIISRLHYITQDLPNFTHAALAELACKSGADWVQLRVKHLYSVSPLLSEKKQYEDWRRIAEETKIICVKYRAKLIINDNVQIAKEINADGVHLGKEDINPAVARKYLGNNFIIGGSTNTIDDVKKRIEEGCDYVGIGPYRYTSTREKLNPILGIDGIRIIAESFSKKIPLIAIGGIKLEDIESLMQAGIHGVAVSSGINLVEDKSEAVRKFSHELHKFTLINSR